MTTTAAAVDYPLDEEQCWSAVCQRDPTAETAFVYGVMTTGVYCRPTCPSRRPRRENARFFVAAASAGAAPKAGPPRAR